MNEKERYKSRFFFCVFIFFLPAIFNSANAIAEFESNNFGTAVFSE